MKLLIVILLLASSAFGGQLQILRTPSAGESLVTAKCQYIFVNAIEDPADLTPPVIYIYRGGNLASLQWRLTERLNLTAKYCGVTAMETNGEIAFNGHLTRGPWTFSFRITG